MGATSLFRQRLEHTGSRVWAKSQHPRGKFGGLLLVRAHRRGTCASLGRVFSCTQVPPPRPVISGDLYTSMPPQPGNRVGGKRVGYCPPPPPPLLRGGRNRKNLPDSRLRGYPAVRLVNLSSWLIYFYFLSRAFFSWRSRSAHWANTVGGRVRRCSSGAGPLLAVSPFFPYSPHHLACVGRANLVGGSKSPPL